MALDRQCPVMNWRDDSDYILSPMDREFATTQMLNPKQLQRIICVFEKAVNFLSTGPCISFNDMRLKIMLAYPTF